VAWDKTEGIGADRSCSHELQVSCQRQRASIWFGPFGIENKDHPTDPMHLKLYLPIDSRPGSNAYSPKSGGCWVRPGGGLLLFEGGNRKRTSSGTFRVGVEKRYFEDYIPGSVHEFGPITVEEKEIIAFAKRYDPQIFHTDPEAATKHLRGLDREWMVNGIVDDAVIG
jgi:hypothetical protein